MEAVPLNKLFFKLLGLGIFTVILVTLILKQTQSTFLALLIIAAEVIISWYLVVKEPLSNREKKTLSQSKETNEQKYIDSLVELIDLYSVASKELRDAEDSGIIYYCSDCESYHISPEISDDEEVTLEEVAVKELFDEIISKDGGYIPTEKGVSKLWLIASIIAGVLVTFSIIVTEGWMLGGMTGFALWLIGKHFLSAIENKDSYQKTLLKVVNSGEEEDLSNLEVLNNKEKEIWDSIVKEMDRTQEELKDEK